MARALTHEYSSLRLQLEYWNDGPPWCDLLENAVDALISLNGSSKIFALKVRSGPGNNGFWETGIIGSLDKPF